MAGPKYRKKLDKRKREIRDRKNYGQYGSGFNASRIAAEDKFLNRLGGFSIERGPRGNVLRYPGQDNQDLRYDAEYNLETSSPFGVWPQALSRGIPSAGYQKYVGMMGDDPEEKEKQDLILQGLEMQPKFSSYPLTRSDVGDIAFRTGDTGMYNTDAENWYYGKPTEGTMARANPLVQELTGTGDIPLYDIRRPEDIAWGYRESLPEDAQWTKPRQYIPNTMGADRGPEFGAMTGGLEPANIGFDRAGAEPALPPTSLGFDRAGAEPALPYDLGFQRAGADEALPYDLGFQRAGADEALPPTSLGWDRMAGGIAALPPSDIGFDRAGPRERSMFEKGWEAIKPLLPYTYPPYGYGLSKIFK